MKYELKRSEKRKIRESWFAFSSIPPKPSVSTRIRSMLGLFSLGMVFFQSHNPLVHGFIVGPTWKPLFF
jgi:hypothetical protein